MSGESRASVISVGVFPSSDHFPWGRAYSRIETTPEPASAVRPFGLTLAVAPSAVTRIDPAELGYDEDAQVGLIRDGTDMVPLSRHTDGQTNTITDRGDSQSTNKDSDTDYQEG
jgi:putative ATP-grasp target RiPP